MMEDAEFARWEQHIEAIIRELFPVTPCSVAIARFEPPDDAHVLASVTFAGHTIGTAAMAQSFADDREAEFVCHSIVGAFFRYFNDLTGRSSRHRI